MLPLGTRVDIKEGTKWASQIFYKNKRYQGTIVANKHEARDDYKYGDLLNDDDEFDYAVVWDYQDSADDGYFYPESHLIPLSLDTNEEALILLEQEE